MFCIGRNHTNSLTHDIAVSKRKDGGYQVFGGTSAISDHAAEQIFAKSPRKRFSIDGGPSCFGDSGGPLFRLYGWSLNLALRLRWLVVVGLIALTAVCFNAFAKLPQQFFPDSNTPIFFVHYKLPQGNSIDATSRDMKIVEDWLSERDEVVSVATFVGQGATRFMLTSPLSLTFRLR